VRTPAPALIALAIAVIALAIGAGTASAATTRAEWVAQVDPICQSASKPAGSAAKGYFKTLNRAGKHTKNPKQLSHVLTAASLKFLRRLATIYSTITERVAVVPPEPGDVGAVNAWLDGRRAAKADVDRALILGKHGKAKKAGRFFIQASQAESQGTANVQNFGLSVCVGQTVIDWQQV
jgi:hypothetical protein